MTTLSNEQIIERYKKIKEREKRNWVKNLLIVQKAKSKGITVSENEIDEYIKNKK